MAICCVAYEREQKIFCDRQWRLDPPFVRRIVRSGQMLRRRGTSRGRREAMNVNTISPHELQRHRQAGKVVDLIDVRTPVEYAEIHVEGARLMPLNTLDPQAIASGRNGE